MAQELQRRGAPDIPMHGGMLAPTNAQDAWNLAEMMARSDLVPKDYRGKPANVLVAMQMGAEVGLRPMAAVQGIAVINGRPSIWGDAMIGLCLAHPSVTDIREVWPDESNGWTATCTVIRQGRQPTIRKFSRADAKQANLLGKEGPWRNFPQRMIAMRARAFALRDSCADILRGLAMAEEASDIEPEPDPLAAAVVVETLNSDGSITTETTPSLSDELYGDDEPAPEPEPAPAPEPAESAQEPAQDAQTWTDPQSGDVVDTGTGEVLERGGTAAGGDTSPDGREPPELQGPNFDQVLRAVKAANDADALAAAEDDARSLNIRRGTKRFQEMDAAIQDARRRCRP